MPIVKRPTTHTRKRVLERQAPGAPMGLIALAFVSAGILLINRKTR